MKLRRTTILTFAAAVALGTAGGSAVAAPAAGAADQTEQRDFTAAANEFHVPRNVLLGVSYLQSRWENHDGRPSVAGGYGPMHLTDVATANKQTHGDAKGDPRHPLSSAVTETVGAQTLQEAARLIDVSPDVLRSDARQNIRGGAALLAKYAKGDATDLASYTAAIDRLGGGQSDLANEVRSVLATGMHVTTSDGQALDLPADPSLGRPRTQQATKNDPHTECPGTVSCDWVPAPYEKTKDGYGNHDLAQRPESQKIDYIVIHDTEAPWDSTLKMAQDPNWSSWNYTVRSSDGKIAQHVPTKDVAWHAGNWYVNSRGIGVEHEGYAAQGSWYTEAMYRQSAKLVRYLAEKFDVPLDRQHILGHDNVPSLTAKGIPAMHQDPGPYWDWAHYFALLGKPLGNHEDGSSLVTVKPNYATNKPRFTGCDADEPQAVCPPHGSGTVILHQSPNENAPLLRDEGLHGDGPTTDNVTDLGSRIETGQQFALAGRSGDWLAVWFNGHKGWFHNPHHSKARVGGGTLVTPRPGLKEVPVYGGAYPDKNEYPPGVDSEQLSPLPYQFGAGQRYALGGTAPSQYYFTDFDSSKNKVIRGATPYYEIQFGHRVGYVKAADVTVTD